MNLAPLPIQKFFSNNGRPLAGGKLFTYVSGTTTKIATYTDSSGGSSNTNPIILDFRGECRLWIDPTKSYTFVLAPSTDTDPPTNPIWTVNDITAGPAQQDNSAVDTGSVNNIALAIPQISSPIAFTRIVFKAANTNTAAVTISINGGTAKALTWQNVAALSGGEVQANGIYEAVFDGAQWQLQGPTLQPPEMRTGAEGGASVTPSVYSRQPGDIKRMGALNGANSSTAINNTVLQDQQGFGTSDAAATYIPYGNYTLNARIDVTATASIYGLGYASSLKVASGATYIPLLVQHSTFQEILGIRLSNFRIDGNDAGQLDAGLIQLNNAVGFVLEKLHLANTDGRVSGASGVNGISVSVGSLGAAGKPMGVICNSFFENLSKSAVNWTTQCDSGAIFGNIARNGSGTGIVPGYQVNGGLRARIFGNDAHGFEGRGFYIATDGNDVAPLYPIVALNHSYGNGTGSGGEGDGIALSNPNAGTASTGIRALVALNTIVSNGSGGTVGCGVNIQNEKKIQVQGNWIKDQKLHGTLVNYSVTTVEDIRVLDNVYENNNTTNNAAGACVYVKGNANRVSISRNKGMNVDGAGNQKYGVYIDDASTIDILTIRDNEFADMVTANYYLGSSGPAAITRYDLDLRIPYQTTDNVQKTILAIPIVDNTSMLVEIDVDGTQTTGGNRAGYKRVALVYRNGGGATIQGGAQTSLFQQESNANWDASIGVTGNFAVILLVGDTAQTVNWETRVRVMSR